MPTINIPPKVRFALYLIGVIGAVLVQYAIDKQWFGEAELRLWSGIAAVLFALALAKTSLSDDTAQVTGTVVSESGETGVIEATVEAGDESKRLDILGKAFTGGTFSKAEEDARDERGVSDVLAAVLAVVVIVLLLAALGVFR